MTFHTFWCGSPQLTLLTWGIVPPNMGKGSDARPFRAWFQCMSPKSAQRFWENDMHQNKDLKRVV
ncbi:MAG: hypothetical protein E5W55_04640 [Mesorhizobium sp.]|nr:MAG: hypothetical protein E5W55_04640 [Mesorhizobium sp.]